MRLKLFTLLFLLLPFLLQAQDSRTRTRDFSIMDLPQGFTFSALNGYGYSTLFNSNISNISSVNPAALASFKNLSFGLSYQFSSKIDSAETEPPLFYTRNHERHKHYLPQSAGMVFPVGRIKLGFGFNQYYNSVSKTDTKTQKSIALDYSLLSSISFSKLFLSKDKFSLGAKISFTSVNHSEEDLDYDRNIHLSGIFYSFGFIYNFYRNYYLGIYYEKRDHIKENVSDNEDAIANFQSHLNIDLGISILEKLILYGHLSQVYWHNDAINDDIDYSVGMIYQALNHFDFSLGFFTNDFNPKQNSPINYIDYYDAYFISSGLSFKYNYLQIDITLADSHLSTSELIKQTIFKMAGSYSFGDIL